MSFEIGAGGTGGNGVGEPPTNTQGNSGTGGATTLSGATTGPIFTLNGGSGAVSVSGGRVFKGTLPTSNARCWWHYEQVLQRLVSIWNNQ